MAPSVHTTVKPVLSGPLLSGHLPRAVPEIILITVKLICIKRSPVLSGCTGLFGGPSELFLLSLQLYLY